MPYRVLHFSDVHVEEGFRTVPARLFANKRLAGYANLRLRRRKRFADAPAKLRRLAAYAVDRRVDACICTGDYTALGTEPELAFARRLVAPLVARGPYVTVPGNHDVYLDDAAGAFERQFAPQLVSDAPELPVDGPWPLLRLIGDDVAVLAVNSARPNPSVQLSSGAISTAQITALSQAWSHPLLERRFVFVATHYAPRLASGKPDSKRHGLDNADAFLAACRPEGTGRGAIVHGHVHHNFMVQVPETPLPIFGAGSATEAGHEGAWRFDVGTDAVEAVPLRYDATHGYVEDETRAERLPRGLGAALEHDAALR